MHKQCVFVLASMVLLTSCSGTRPDLGLNNGKLTPCPESPNCVNSQAADEEHYIAPLQFSGTHTEAHERLVQIIESEKRTKILAAEENYIRVEFTSALFRFVDDVEFYVTKAQDGRIIIHVRSASRIGYSVQGVNRKRIERIRNMFQN